MLLLSIHASFRGSFRTFIGCHIQGQQRCQGTAEAVAADRELAHWPVRRHRLQHVDQTSGGWVGGYPQRTVKRREAVIGVPGPSEEWAVDQQEITVVYPLPDAIGATDYDNNVVVRCLKNKAERNNLGAPQGVQVSGEIIAVKRVEKKNLLGSTWRKGRSTSLPLGP
jgi:hypothetical protein